MNVEALHSQALDHLERADRIMRQLTALSPDWTARIQVRQQFAYLLHDCRDFATYQLGIRAISSERRK